MGRTGPIRSGHFKKSTRYIIVFSSLILISVTSLSFYIRKSRINSLANKGFNFYYIGELNQVLGRPYKIECEFPKNAKIKDFSFPHMPSIKEAVIWNQDLNISNFENLIDNLQLEKLDLRGCFLPNRFDKSISLPNLTYLRVSKTDINDRVLIKILNASPSLKVLRSSDTSITSDIIPSINSLKNLKELSLSNTNIRSDEFKRLTGYNNYDIVSENIYESIEVHK